VDFEGVFRVLKSAGYDGWISLEAGGKKGKEDIRRGIEYIRNVWLTKGYGTKYV
jgi:sugar phosphate isomerase/epimerase